MKKTTNYMLSIILLSTSFLAHAGALTSCSIPWERDYYDSNGVTYSCRNGNKEDFYRQIITIHNKSSQTLQTGYTCPGFFGSKTYYYYQSLVQFRLVNQIPTIGPNTTNTLIVYCTGSGKRQFTIDAGSPANWNTPGHCDINEKERCRYDLSQNIDVEEANQTFYVYSCGNNNKGIYVGQENQPANTYESKPCIW